MEKISLEEYAPVMLANGKMLYSDEGKVSLQHKTGNNTL
jgi:hypothetical protein